LAIITFMTRYMVRRDPPLRIMFYNSLIGVVLFGLITCYFGMRHGWHLPNPSFIPVAILNGIAWAVALFFFLEAFYTTESHVIGAISLLLPFFVETLNWVNNGEIVSWKTMLATVVSSLGAILVIVSSYNEDKKHKRAAGQKQYKIPETVEDEEFD